MNEPVRKNQLKPMVSRERGYGTHGRDATLALDRNHDASCTLNAEPVQAAETAADHQCESL